MCQGKPLTKEIEAMAVDRTVRTSLLEDALENQLTRQSSPGMMRLMNSSNSGTVKAVSP